MPSCAEQPGRRETLTRDVARRQAVGVLRLAESIAGYAAASIGNGLSPADARRAALDVAAELAAALRRLTRLDLDPAQRRAMAVELAASVAAADRRAARRQQENHLDRPCGPPRRTLPAASRERSRTASPQESSQSGLDLRISGPVP